MTFVLHLRKLTKIFVMDLHMVEKYRRVNAAEVTLVMLDFHLTFSSC